MLEFLKRRNEPITVMQITYQLKTQRKYIDEALSQLRVAGMISSKEIARNQILYYVPLDP